MNIFDATPINVTTIKVADRTVDGFYELDGGRIDVHLIDIEIGGQIRVPINQTQFRQSLSIRVWVSKTSHGQELFFRFHPGTGGAAHLFFDEDLDPAPKLIQSPIQRSLFSAQEFRFSDIPVPLAPGRYYYNIQNMENRPVGYKVAFIGPGFDC